MTDTSELAAWIGCTALDRDGDELGEIVDLYLDDATGEASWLAVRTGLFGRRISFVPIAGAEPDGESLRAAFDKALIKGAPNVDPDGTLDPAEEERLYDHYGIDVVGVDDDGAEAAGLEGSGAGTDAPTPDAVVIRGEEEIPDGRGRARLRRWVYTEHVSEPVPVGGDAGASMPRTGGDAGQTFETDGGTARQGR